MNVKRYNPKEIESKWQKYWDDNQTYKADLHTDKRKYMGMSMFNYPSGAGIHIGHAMNYTISDVMARFKRQQGYESYHPVGWDAFGLPAENYAIKTGVSPQQSMAKIIPDYHKQYKAMGWSNDWSKEISTHEPQYYKWTQWIFAQMYKQGLVYQDARMQWWCTKCQTVLANEQVIDGKCWRHDGPNDLIVEKREVKQWFFKITDYADELLEATDALDWTETVKLAQKNWIGKSKGAEIEFAVDGSDEKITVFTTRPDTLFGATFMVLAPEHPLVEEIVINSQKSEVAEYIKQAQAKTEVERQASKEKTGVFTGAYAVNPVNDEKMPIWIADYVLFGYGTGAIMAVPAHDERDNEFAQKFNLPVTYVIEPTFGQSAGDDTHKESIFVVLRNPDKTKAVVLDWGPRRERFGGNMLIGGGVEGDEDPVETAKREIAEETGYKNFTFVAKSPFKGHGYFYSNTKNKNMHVSGHGLLFDLVDEERGDPELDEGEKDKFSVTWESIERIATMLDDGVHEAMFRHLALGECYHDEGVLTNSAQYDGMDSADAREKIVADLEKKGVAKEVTNYKIRDWSVSRQRYWGAPIPIIHCPKDGIVPVPDDQLPVVLPELTDFAPSGDGRSALARATDWLKVKCPTCGGPAERETDTLDTYICSSWYFLRYIDPTNDTAPFDSKLANNWMPVDFYNGGDHATAHMIYARFVTRFFHKLGLLDNPEPFKRFLFNGKVTAQNGEMFSKSKGNGVDPLEIIEQGYGADALRTYLMFAAPLDLWIRWDPQGVPGTYRFINRVWNLTQEFLESKTAGEASDKPLKIIHPAIQKVTEDLENQKYNTAIAALMKATNDLYELKAKDRFADTNNWRFALESLVMMSAPFAPHAAEQLWHDLGHEDSVHRDHWPQWDDQYLVRDSITIAVQVNGKLRGTIEVAADTEEADIVAAAKTDEKISAHLTSEPKKTIYIKNKLINFVV
jgi:leucyl-tRNA synthetase